MRDLRRAVRRKAGTFVTVWRLEGPRTACVTGVSSARNSARWWSSRLLRQPRRVATLPPTPVAVSAPEGEPDGERGATVLVAVVVRVGEVAPDAVRATLRSVLAQTHSQWELCVCAWSADAAVEAALAELRGSDARIRILPPGSASGPAEAADLAAQQARGSLLFFVDAGDELHPEALAEVAAAAADDPFADVVYVDEETRGGEGRPVHTRRKPDWSPSYLESCMYVGRGIAVRKKTFWRLGGLRPAFDGAHDYDLLLRVARAGGRVAHVRRVLYRRAPEAAAGLESLAAARAALEAYASDLGMPATVEAGLAPGAHRVRRRPDETPEVTLLILTCDPLARVDGRVRVRLLASLLRSLQDSLPGTARVLVVDDGELSEESAAALAAVGGRRSSFVDPLRGSLGFSFARKANFAVAQAETDHVILMNDDLETPEPGWVEALLEPLHDPTVGVTGAKLLYPDGTLQHAGIVLGGEHVSAHVFRGLPDGEAGPPAQVIREYSAVTGAVMAFRRATFEEAGGLDEVFPHDYQDVDFCMRVLAGGLRVVFTPYSRLVHLEGKSFVRGSRFQEEEALFSRRWAGIVASDPSRGD